MANAMATQAEGILDIAPEQHPRPAPRVLVFCGGKGGVGKTQLAANLAVALAARHHVLLLTADLCFAAPGCFHANTTLELIASGERTIDETMHKGPAGIDMLPAIETPLLLAHLPPWQQERLARQISAAAAQRDFALIDCPAETLPAIAAAEAVVVSTPEAASLAGAYAQVKRLAQTAPCTTISLLLNGVEDASEAASTFRKLTQTARRFLGITPACLGWVPSDHSVAKAARRRVPFVVEYADRPAAAALKAIAARLSSAQSQRANPDYIVLGTCRQ